MYFLPHFWQVSLVIRYRYRYLSTTTYDYWYIHFEERVRCVSGGVTRYQYNALTTLRRTRNKMRHTVGRRLES
jgi:hypothetical protein